MATFGVIHNSNLLGPPTPKHACSTCLHRPKTMDVWARCQATNNYIEDERMMSAGACGIGGRLWEPIPPKPPRLGLIRWLWRLLFGEWTR